MIGAVVRISWLALVRDRYALVLSFVVPVIFFSILALIFGGSSGGALPTVRVVIVDEDRTPESGLLVQALENEPSLAVEPLPPDAGAPSREAARRLVQRGDLPVAIVIPAGFGERVARFPARALSVELLSDRTADPVAHHLAAGLLHRAMIFAAPERLLRGVAAWIEGEAGALTPAQRALVEDVARALGAPRGEAAAPGAAPFEVVATDVHAASGHHGKNVVAYFAAGIGVMFLLFTMTTAMRGLIAEEETGTLERLLSTELTMGRLLLARWLFATALGSAQLSVMFLWAWAVFGVDVFGQSRLPGLVLMTVAAAAAAASFGLVLGTACRTQAQLQGLATVVILLMSALGGSMVPRYLMPEAMQRLGLVTFNAWAVMGYEKVFWRDAPAVALWPQVCVLAGMTAVGLVVARRLARRWESA